MRRDEEFQLFLETEHFLCADGLASIEEKKSKRMPGAVVPSCRQIGIEDRDGNKVYHSIVYKPQLDDVIKACRKSGILAKTFVYDRATWEAEKAELVTLKESYENKRKHLNQVSTDLF